MDTTEKKAQRFRSVAYPSYSLSESVDFVKSINQHFGNTTFNTREGIAQVLGTGVGTLLMRLSTATQYGLLEMKSKEGYKPTPLFTSLYKPLNDLEKYAAQIECLGNSELYYKLIGQFSGKQLPTPEGLSVLLYRSYKVAEDASLKVAKIFLNNLTEAGLINGNNELKEDEIPLLEQKKQTAEEFTYITGPIKKQLNTPTNYIDIIPPVPDNIIQIPIFLKGVNRMAKVLIPSDFTNEDLDQISKMVLSNKRPE